LKSSAFTLSKAVLLTNNRSAFEKALNSPHHQLTMTPNQHRQLKRKKTKKKPRVT
jgi:hypothetical protein